MTTFMQTINNLFRREDGQALPEYGLIIFFVAIVAIAALTLLGTNMQTLINNIANAI